MRLKTAKQRTASSSPGSSASSTILSGGGQARGIPLALRLQADRDRRQAPPAEAWQARRRPWRSTRRLAQVAAARARSAGGKGQVVAIDLLPMEPIAGWSSCGSISWTRRRRPASRASARGQADVVLSDMAAQGTGTRHRPPAHHGLAEAAAEFASSARPRRGLRLQGAPGRHRARAAGTAQARICHRQAHQAAREPCRVGRALRPRHRLQGRCERTLP